MLHITDASNVTSFICGSIYTTATNDSRFFNEDY